MELANAVVQVARFNIDQGKYVALTVLGTQGSQIVDIEHVGGGLIRYKYYGLRENDVYVPVANIVSIDVRPGDWDK